MRIFAVVRGTVIVVESRVKMQDASSLSTLDCGARVRIFTRIFTLDNDTLWCEGRKQSVIVVQSRVKMQDASSL